MGQILTRSGIGDALAISVIGVCSMIGAMVGIIGAGIMTSSSIALIPPSIPMIMFASATQNSVGKMFLGAMVPALITIVLLISYVVISCKIKPERAPFDSDNDIEIPKGYQLFKTIRDGASSFALIVVVLGSSWCYSALYSV